MTTLPVHALGTPSELDPDLPLQGLSRTLSTPVAMIAFNRPDVLRRTFAAVRAAQPSRLFLICDGPRPDRPDDPRRCAEVRSILETVDWPCQVERLFSETNQGCEATVELGLDWVFSQVDRAIVLEDDCLPHPTFFPFVQELLDRYVDDERVWHIAGNSHMVAERLFRGDSYAFSTWASVWGWATWAGRWQSHRESFPRDHVPGGQYGERGDLPRRVTPAVPRPGSLVTRGGQRHFAEAARSLDVVTHGWDKQWWLSIMTAGGLSVTPAVNLVQNVGFDADATHTGAPGRRDAPSCAIAFPLSHPAEVRLAVDVERDLELELGRIGGRAARVARRAVRSPMLRRILRSVVHSAPAREASRQTSKLMRRGSRVER